MQRFNTVSEYTHQLSLCGDKDRRCSVQRARDDMEVDLHVSISSVDYIISLKSIDFHYQHHHV
jgi:hypothetical protein